MRVVALPPPSARRTFGALRGRRGPVESEVALTWDEYTFARLALSSLRAARSASGVIWATDDWLRGQAKARTLLTRFLLRRADCLWCLSRPQVEVTKLWLGKGAPPVSFLKFGIDESFFTAHPLPTGAPTVFSAGHDRRDVETLLAAFELVRQEIPSARAVVQTPRNIAAPPGVKLVKRFAHRELRDAYRAASVVAIATHPNVHVSGMTVCLEAQATGRPVILTHTPGADDYVEHGTTGALVRQADAADMASAIVSFLSDRERSNRVGAAGRLKVENEHTTAKMVEAMDRIISAR